MDTPAVAIRCRHCRRLVRRVHEFHGEWIPISQWWNPDPMMNLRWRWLRLRCIGRRHTLDRTVRADTLARWCEDAIRTGRPEILL